jgi:hypothetical protein
MNYPSNKIIDDYIILDNFVPVSLQNEIEEMLLSSNFPWYIFSEIWLGASTPQNLLSNKNILNASGLVHNFVNEGLPGSEYRHSFIYILHFLSKELKFDVNEILRIRGRTTFQYPESNHNTFCGPHVDFSMRNDYYSLIYYANDSDGDTFLFEEERTDKDSNFYPNLSNLKIRQRITPKKGRLLLFNGNILHAGNCPINSQVRCVINYDFTASKNYYGN